MISDETATWFRQLVSDTQQRLGALDRLQEHPESYYGRAELREGITAVVAPGGTPVDLTLSHSALRLDPQQLAERILHAQRQAADDANRRYAQAVDVATGHRVDVTAIVERRLDQRRIREAAGDE